VDKKDKEGGSETREGGGLFLAEGGKKRGVGDRKVEMSFVGLFAEN